MPSQDQIEWDQISLRLLGPETVQMFDRRLVLLVVNMEFGAKVVALRSEMKMMTIICRPSTRETDQQIKEDKVLPKSPIKLVCQANLKQTKVGHSVNKNSRELPQKIKLSLLTS